MDHFEFVHAFRLIEFQISATTMVRSNKQVSPWQLHLVKKHEDPVTLSFKSKSEHIEWHDAFKNSL